MNLRACHSLKCPVHPVLRIFCKKKPSYFRRITVEPRRSGLHSKLVSKFFNQVLRIMFNSTRRRKISRILSFFRKHPRLALFICPLPLHPKPTPLSLLPATAHSPFLSCSLPLPPLSSPAPRGRLPSPTRLLAATSLPLLLSAAALSLATLFLLALAGFLLWLANPDVSTTRRRPCPPRAPLLRR